MATLPCRNRPVRKKERDGSGEILRRALREQSLQRLEPNYLLPDVLLPAPAPVPVPLVLPAPAPVPAPVPLPAPAPVPVPELVPAPVPELVPPAPVPVLV